jgi:hypothetical protein
MSTGSTAVHIVVRSCAWALLILINLPLRAEVPATQERMFEWTIESHKEYADPFNDVEVDVIFSKDRQSWRVPTFWRGGQRWTVRFAPPAPGEYRYRLQSTDTTNPDLNGHQGRVAITAYHGSNQLLHHGMLRVSANKRYFEHADGTPFYWLGDTWWSGLSDRLSWEGFQKLADDRQAKGFTVVQTVAGLVPAEEVSPVDSGCRNEGGAVWDPQFNRINPQYFDYADRRIQSLIDHGLVPAIVGAWSQVLPQMGAPKMKRHWRYLIARYGAYPVFWILGGQVSDPPKEEEHLYSGPLQGTINRGWTEIARYVRAIDPYHHPLTVHENPPPYDTTLQGESLTDFDLFQSSHFGWASIAVEVAQIDQHYSRTAVTKPVVEGEIGYEKLGETHFEDFQRTAFWLSMLNGAAGHTYGANGVFEAYTADKPFQRLRWSLMTWEEGMHLPGSYQVGLGAKLLKTYPWWRFAPHPEWVTPRGTTLLEPHAQIHGFDYRTVEPYAEFDAGDPLAQQEATPVAAEWMARRGTFRQPYAAGIPGKVRMIYVPSLGTDPPPAPTVLGLEAGVRYHAYWWEPSTGTRFDLGAVERPSPGPVLFDSSQHPKHDAVWSDGAADTPSVLKDLNIADMVVSVETTAAGKAGIVLRYRDPKNYLAAIYSPEEKALYLIEYHDGAERRPLGKTPIPTVGTQIKISAEVRENQAAGSISDGARTYTTPVVDLSGSVTGSAGVLPQPPSVTQPYARFEVRASPVLVKDERLDRHLIDGNGAHRGDLAGPDLTIGTNSFPGWDRFGRDKHILLDAYRPGRLPMSGDWVLVLDAHAGSLSN